MIVCLVSAAGLVLFAWCRGRLRLVRLIMPAGLIGAGLIVAYALAGRPVPLACDLPARHFDGEGRAVFEVLGRPSPPLEQLLAPD